MFRGVGDKIAEITSLFAVIMTILSSGPASFGRQCIEMTPYLFGPVAHDEAILPVRWSNGTRAPGKVEIQNTTR